VLTKELEEQNQVLESVNAEKDKFFSILAHDLRGPLSAFVAATQIITEDILTMEKAEIKDITLSMKASATNIYSLLENLLEWSHMMRGGVDFIPEKFNLKKKVETGIDVLSESANKKRIEMTICIQDEIEVFADNHMFDTIMRNMRDGSFDEKFNFS
jgi:signal transduction histidine kinase